MVLVLRVAIHRLNKSLNSHPFTNPGSRWYNTTFGQGIAPQIDLHARAIPGCKVDKDVGLALASAKLSDVMPHFDNAPDQFHHLADIPGKRRVARGI
ncbi:hypothetical protein D3C87_2004900 [compost metagenome]